MNYVITGANGPLGVAICKYLIEEKSCNVLCATRSMNPLQFEGTYKQISGIDLLQEESLERLAQETNSYFSESFNIINAVGHFKNGQQPFLETSLFEAELIFKSNFTAIYNTAFKLLPVQISKGGGHFIVFSCDSTNFNYPLMNPFISAKSALNSFIKSLANEFYRLGIIANAFALTTVRTELEIKTKPHGDFENWLDPEEVAQKIFELTNISTLISGNIIKLYKHSDTFFGKSYYDRILK